MVAEQKLLRPSCGLMAKHYSYVRSAHVNATVLCRYHTTISQGRKPQMLLEATSSRNRKESHLSFLPLSRSVLWFDLHSSSQSQHKLGI